MAVNDPRMGAKGGDERFDTSSIRGVREERGIVEGIVKANVHNANMGVISVWIPTFTTDQTDKNQWRQVRYCTPFYSSSKSEASPGGLSFDTKTSAGLITPPPDIGTRVLCVFPEGRNAQGYYFACIPDLYMQQSFPESTLNQAGEAASEVNDKDVDTRQADNFSTLQRDKDLLVDQMLRVQGLQQDTTRGINNSSVMRESPTEVIGLASKGRRITKQGQDFLETYAGNLEADVEGLLAPRRRKGHSITLDDGDINGDSNQIRLRTSTGHQILMNDTEGVIYVGNSTGTAWIELGATGAMDVYAADSINFRSANINFHADQNIKFHSKGFTQIVAEQQVHVEGKTQAVVVSQQGEAGISGSKGLHLQSGSSLYATAGSMAYMSAGGIMSVSGSLVMLQGPRTPAKQGQPVTPFAKQNTEWNGTQFAPGPQTQTSVDRAVTHEPFAEHGLPNSPTPYTGGLVGGGGGLGGAFSIISAAGPLTSGLGAASGLSAGGLEAFGGAGPAISGIGGSGLGSLGSALSGSGLGSALGNITSAIPGDFAGAIASGSSFLPAGLTDSVTSLASGALPGGLTDSVLGSISSGLNTDALSGFGVDKFVSLADGSIANLADVSNLAGGDLLSAAQNLGGNIDFANVADNFTNIVDLPIDIDFPVTDVISQVNNGFSVGILDTVDVQALNAAIVNTTGSNGALDFISSATKSVGKYGFNVEQLKKTGLVNADAIFNDQLSNPSVWTGKLGASSLNDFLGNGQLQEEIQQALIVEDYQSLVNIGGIKTTDGIKETMGMLTASMNSDPQLASLRRQGFQDIANQANAVLTNRTNIENIDNAASEIDKYIQTGSFASDLSSGLKKAQAAVTTTTTVEEETVKETVTGGGSTTTTSGGFTGRTRTSNAYDPYSGPNGPRKKQLDEQIDALDQQRLNAYVDNESEETKDRLEKEYRALLAERNRLR